MTGFFAGATAVALLQFLRVRDGRMLLLVALFALHGLSHVLGQSTTAGTVADLLSGCCGLALLLWLSPRQPHAPSR